MDWLLIAILIAAVGAHLIVAGFGRRFQNDRDPAHVWRALALGSPARLELAARDGSYVVLMAASPLFVSLTSSPYRSTAIGIEYARPRGVA